MSTFLTRDRSVSLQPVSQLAARSLDWLWPGRLALGKLAMLDGDPGMGRSLLALDLCARLSTAGLSRMAARAPDRSRPLSLTARTVPRIPFVPGCRPWAPIWSVSSS
jgi:hypothetical protein